MRANSNNKLIGAAVVVHRELGPGFLEQIFHTAMRVSLTHRNVPFESQVPVDISFEEEFVGRARLDMIVGHQIIVELKAVERLHEVHFAQIKSYLRAARLRVGLLLNFQGPTLVIRRVVLG
jgi:GxxExxY protein